MSEKSHLRIAAKPDTRRYKYAGGGGGVEFKLPPRDRLTHAAKLEGELFQASVAARQASEEQGIEGGAKAFVYTFRSEPGHKLMLSSLERPAQGIELQSVKNDGDVEVATIRVQTGQLRVFFNLIKAYKRKASKSGNYRNKNLIESISNISLAALRDLWQDPSAFPAPNEQVWWEVWIRLGPGGASGTFSRFRSQLVAAGLRTIDQSISFPERVVTLACGTQEQLSSSLDLLAELAELRRAKELASEYVTLPPRYQRDYIEDAEQRIVKPAPDAPAVCLLDTGVNRGHPLLAIALDEDDVQALRPEWGSSDHDSGQHGTAMAGVALYGCLTDLFDSTGPYVLRHRLESVKLLPPVGSNEPDLYGALTQEAVARAEVQAPQRLRSICLTITSDTDDKALPSSWSAAIDQMCSGHLDQTRRLMFIAAGNVGSEFSTVGYKYHQWNCECGGLEDPGQSWNAVTVGAITEKAFVKDPDYRDWQVMAESGDLAPASRTSLAWPEQLHRGWPLKPDLVLEGGNYIEKDGDRTSLDDLSVLTTVMKSDGKRLATTGDTSAATAAGARLGAIIASHYPRYWPETIRALLVHSARWTDAMRTRFPGSARASVQQRLRCYGYGIPRLSKALWSAEHSVTMIFEGDLQPYTKVGDDVQTNEMHIHQLPWPREALLGLGDTQLSMRVTLSYFVEPSPGRIGWQKRHRYQSHGLRFDVIRPLENEFEFRQRISRN
ncbi:MAG TPA: S8 family peptidase [Tepidisphaeraceae bacterium]|jgi:hypothetical protein|nr:S8 family peptidase [Tepidisphaeraceae bacterium]